MRNITVSVPDDVYKRARVKAAEQDTTVSAVVRDCLEKYAAEQPGAWPRKFFEAVDRIRERQRREGKYFSAGDRLTRDELHDRDALRRHEHNPVQR